MKYTPSREMIFRTCIMTAAALALIAAQSVYAWMGPRDTPPRGNVDVVINAGAGFQSKKGNLGLGGLAVFGQSVFNGTLKIADGTQDEGKILTSDAAGNASWQYPAPVPTCTAEAQNACPSGSSQMSINGQTFCGYSKSGGGGITYCNGSDTIVFCEDMGVGKNHGVNTVNPNGCNAWEGAGNGGGPGVMLYCKSGPAPAN